MPYRSTVGSHCLNNDLVATRAPSVLSVRDSMLEPRRDACVVIGVAARKLRMMGQVRSGKGMDRVAELTNGFISEGQVRQGNGKCSNRKVQESYDSWCCPRNPTIRNFRIEIERRTVHMLMQKPLSTPE